MNKIKLLALISAICMTTALISACDVTTQTSESYTDAAGNTTTTTTTNNNGNVTTETTTASGEDEDSESDEESAEETGGESQVVEQAFRLTNNTGIAIHELNVSPSEQEVWGANFIPEGAVIADGESGTVNFSLDATAQYWDLRVKDGQGDSLYWYDLDLFEISQITLYYENGEGTAELN